MTEQEVKDLRKRQEEELKRMGIYTQEDLLKAMEGMELDISCMVVPFERPKRNVS